MLTLLPLKFLSVSEFFFISFCEIWLSVDQGNLVASFALSPLPSDGSLPGVLSVSKVGVLLRKFPSVSEFFF